MDDSSSSVDSVCWGPYTIKEARADILKGKPRQIDRRHSCIAKYEHFNMTSQESAVLSDSTTFATASTSFVTAPTEASDCDLLDASVITISTNDDFDQDEHGSYQQVSDVSGSMSDSHCKNLQEECQDDSLVSRASTGIDSYQSHISDASVNLNKTDTSDDLNNTFELINRLLAQSEVDQDNSSPPSTPVPLKPLDNLTKKYPKSESKIPITTTPSFKVPIKSASHKKITPNFKNIVSPVGLYIKHGTQYVPLVNVPENKMFRQLFPTNSSEKAMKENIPKNEEDDGFSLPPCIYKPAKKREIKEGVKVNLPDSINKLIRPQIVMKHEGRIEVQHHHEQSMERRLMESDFSINDSQFNQDVSVITQNAPFEV